MQKMIMIPTERYERMMESYDKAMDELHRLREELKTMKEGESPVGKD